MLLIMMNINENDRKRIFIFCYTMYRKKLYDITRNKTTFLKSANVTMSLKIKNL